MSNGILQPGRVAIAVHHHDGPLAHPSNLQIQDAGSVQVHTFGGLTKLEAVAAQIAAGLASNPAVTKRADDDKSPLNRILCEEIAIKAIKTAEQLLSICHLRESQGKPAEQPN